MEKGEAEEMSDAVKKLIMGYQPLEGMFLSRSAHRAVAASRCIQNRYQESNEECFFGKDRLDDGVVKTFAIQAERQKDVEHLQRVEMLFKAVSTELRAPSTSYLPTEWLEKGVSCKMLSKYVWQFTHFVDVKISKDVGYMGSDLNTTRSEVLDESKVDLFSSFKKTGESLSHLAKVAANKTRAGAKDLVNQVKNAPQQGIYDFFRGNWRYVLRKLALWSQEIDALLDKNINPLWRAVRDLETRNTECRITSLAKDKLKYARWLMSSKVVRTFKFQESELYRKHVYDIDATKECFLPKRSFFPKKNAYIIPDEWITKGGVQPTCTEVLEHVGALRTTCDLDDMRSGSQVAMLYNEVGKKVIELEADERKRKTCWIPADKRLRIESEILKIPVTENETFLVLRKTLATLFERVGVKTEVEQISHFVPSEWLGDQIKCQALYDFGTWFEEELLHTNTGKFFSSLVKGLNNNTGLGIELDPSSVGAKWQSYGNSTLHKVRNYASGDFGESWQRARDLIAFYRDLARISLGMKYEGTPAECLKQTHRNEIQQMLYQHASLFKSCVHTDCTPILYAACRENPERSSCRGEHRSANEQCPEGTECRCDAFVNAEKLMKYNAGIFIGGNIAVQGGAFIIAMVALISNPAVGFVAAAAGGIAMASGVCDTPFELAGMAMMTVSMLKNGVGGGCALSECVMKEVNGRKTCSVKNNDLPYIGFKCIHKAANVDDAAKYASIIGGVAGFGISTQVETGLDKFGGGIGKAFKNIGAVGVGAKASGGLVSLIGETEVGKRYLGQKEGCYMMPCDMSAYQDDRVGMYEREDGFPPGTDLYNCPTFFKDPQRYDPYNFGSMMDRKEYYKERLSMQGIDSESDSESASFDFPEDDSNKDGASTQDELAQVQNKSGKTSSTNSSEECDDNEVLLK
eukprot:TRINITY_DN10835_c0_g4_i2.p1 TRINITY_DN10835_c0_g4~~TRINITY_DN10835_c0_g4_i2.p1  ORF type:complete len:973 (+),score=93.67 TRINITY_DN10835_c0_g4_i2:171-2921(+)